MIILILCTNSLAAWRRFHSTLICLAHNYKLFIILYTYGVKWHDLFCDFQIFFWKTKDNSTFSLRVAHGTDTTFAITDLLPYTYYSVTVLAYNAAGDGPVNKPPVAVQTAQSGWCYFFVLLTFGVVMFQVACKFVTLIDGIIFWLHMRSFISTRFSLPVFGEGVYYL